MANCVSKIGRMKLAHVVGSKRESSDIFSALLASFWLMPHAAQKK